jgi:polysaccharide pyruvyl transferase WcaK-like protein
MGRLHRPLDGPVLVVGAYGYGNVGDEAILAGVVARLSGQSVTVVSRSPAQTAATHGVRAIGILRAIPALLGHRSVVIGGGGLFGRDMGRLGRLLPLFGLVAVALGKNVVIEGVDVDERLSRSARVLVPALMRAASRVSVRDRGSLAILTGWGVLSSVQPDLSAWMEPAAPQVGRGALERAGLDLDRPIVGLSLTAVNPRMADRAIEAAAGAIKALPDAQFCFIPMSRHPSVPQHDDTQLARRLVGLNANLVVLDESLTPAAVLSVFGQFSAVVAMRYHAMLFAERAGVPLVPIPYAEKTERWLAEHGRDVVDPTVTGVTRAVETALSERASRRRPQLQAAS